MDEIEKMREELANVRQSALQFDEERDRLRDKLVEVRAELAEANARRNDMRTALEWSNAERDRLRERCETLANNHEYRVEELAARRKECDEARARVESLKQDLANMERMHAEQCRHGVSLERRLLESRAESKKLGDALIQETRLSIAMATQRDEARAEVERLREMAHDFEAMRQDRDHHASALKQERREVERLQGDVWALTTTLRNLPVHPSSLTDACTDSYRRGAEAMREAAINYARKIGFYALAADIRCLPIPEEP